MNTLKKKMIAAIFFLSALLVAANASATEMAQRSLFKVDNLTCISCLNAIQAELEGFVGAVDA